MKLALVTNYGEDRRPLAEYAYHLQQGLASSAPPDTEIVIVAGRAVVPRETAVLRAWTYGGWLLPRQILLALRRIKPDAVLFNTQFTGWGSPVANFFGLLTPWLVKKLIAPTFVLVHHLPHTIDVSNTGYRLSRLHWLAIDVACRAIADTDGVCFLSDVDADCFRRAYGSAKVHLMHHGLLGSPAWRAVPQQRTILAFGKWGRNKTLDQLVGSFLKLPDDCRLVVAGPSAVPGFLEEWQQRHAVDRVHFTGYVPEAEVRDLFFDASLVVLPHRATTGVSGVLLQACQFGRVPVMAGLPLFRSLVSQWGINGYFYDNEEELTQTLLELLSAPGRLAREGKENLERMSDVTLDKVASRYWEMFERNAECLVTTSRRYAEQHRV